MASGAAWLKHAAKVVAVVATLACAAIVFILVNVWRLPAPGDISRVLTQNPELYTLSLGHMGDLTLSSFAYLKLPLVLAGLAFAVGSFYGWRYRGRMTQIGLALMMLLFLNAARIAMIAFDPYLSSQPLAAALKALPKGKVVLGDQYYTFSSVVFYADLKEVLLLNGRYQNLEYGSYAPGAPDVFVDNAGLVDLWRSNERTYLVLEGPKVAGIETLLGKASMSLVKSAGGKFLYTNRVSP
jgi:hypothetical protein